MSPRPFRLRKISNPPLVSGFKPYGIKEGSGNDESVFLHLEEYEALRLCDFEMLNHNQAATLMDVSRPTLTRIYSKARRKISEALVMGKKIIIEGGKIYFDSGWFSCKSCGCFFNNPDKQVDSEKCPLCGSHDFLNLERDNTSPEDILSGCTDICICASCGFEKPHVKGCPCKDEICPVCGEGLLRQGTKNVNSL